MSCFGVIVLQPLGFPNEWKPVSNTKLLLFRGGFKSEVQPPPLQGLPMLSRTRNARLSVPLGMTTACRTRPATTASTPVGELRRDLIKTEAHGSGVGTLLERSQGLPRRCDAAWPTASVARWRGTRQLTQQAGIAVCFCDPHSPPPPRQRGGGPATRTGTGWCVSICCPRTVAGIAATRRRGRDNAGQKLNRSAINPQFRILLLCVTQNAAISN